SPPLRGRRRVSGRSASPAKRAAARPREVLLHWRTIRPPPACSRVAPGARPSARAIAAVEQDRDGWSVACRLVLRRGSRSGFAFRISHGAPEASPQLAMPQLAAKSLPILAVTFPSETCIRSEEWSVTAARLPSKRGAGRYRVRRNAGFAVHRRATAEHLQRSATTIPPMSIVSLSRQVRPA